MCTVSVVPTGHGFRLACNRDEQRTRPDALPPRVRAKGGRRAVWPSDPQSGGTWIGVNDTGLAMVVLNRTSGIGIAAAPPATVSRGILIPRFLAASSLDAAVERAGAELGSQEAPRFKPFTLVMIQGRRTVVVDYRAGVAAMTRRRLTRPLLFTSSSLGDDFVDRPRRRLFAAFMKSARHPLDAQARFHRHRWPRRPEISVWMTRLDAATVSRTTVDVSSATVTVGYSALVT
jgi:hypothetical protein